MQVGHHAAAEPRAQPVLEPRQVGGRLVGRDHDLLAGIDQRVEGVEELFLRVVLADQELQVVDHQHVDAAQLLLELHRRLAADRGDEAVHELLGRHVGDRDRVALAPGQLQADRVHQVGLAEADAAIEEQRVEARARRALGDAAGAGIGELVRLADDEGVEGEALVERAPPTSGPAGRARSAGSARLGSRPAAGSRAARQRLGGAAAGRRGCRPGGSRGSRPARARSAGRRNGCAPSRAGSCVGRWTVTSSPSTPDQRHLPQPGAVFDLADLGSAGGRGPGPTGAGELRRRGFGASRLGDAMPAAMVAGVVVHARCRHRLPTAPRRLRRLPHRIIRSASASSRNRKRPSCKSNPYAPQKRHKSAIAP